MLAKTRVIPVICFCLASLLLASSPDAAEPATSAEWARNAIWDDGLAEVAVYEAGRRIYGADRPYEAVFITVKEEFDRSKLVKADPPYADRPIVTVLKQNAVREIETPNYPYRIMTSTFVERSNPSHVLKITSGSHEWCGNTWQAVRDRAGRVSYHWQSYFDGEADGRQELDLRPGDLFEDQLPLTLRGLEFRKGLELRGRLLPSLADTHGGPLRWREATIRVVGREMVEVAAGEIPAWRVEISAEDYTATLWFDAAPTHLLVRLETAAGDRLLLRSVERRTYWVLPR